MAVWCKHIEPHYGCRVGESKPELSRFARGEVPAIHRGVSTICCEVVGEALVASRHGVRGKCEREGTSPFPTLSLRGAQA
jgi:hypothetical protein